MSHRPRIRVTLLGTGTSTGVPVIGCGCAVCRSADPRDTRLRCAAYVEVGDARLLIDAGPDFRQQALQTPIERVDAVLVTHHHFDHVAGLDDLRPFLFDRDQAPLVCYASDATATVLERMYPYAFHNTGYPGAPQLCLARVGDEVFEVRPRRGGVPVEVEPIRVFHGQLPILGFRIGRFAYLTDTSAIPEESFAQLRGLDVLVLDALRPTPHPTHFTFGEAVDAARRIGARETYFIHLSHNALHAELDAALPTGIHVGYDGLTFEAGL